MNMIRRGAIAGLVFSALSLSFLSFPSKAQVTSNVFMRVLQLQVGEEVGTSFTIDIDGKQYLVTAKHIVAALPDGSDSLVKVRTKGGWSEIHVIVFKCADPVDIAVLIPKKQLTVNLPLEASVTGIMLGQDAYFVGFPYGMNVTYRTHPNVFPFVKRATLSALVRQENINTQIIVLDGENNPGFSGSPVVFHNPYYPHNDFRVAGVISGFLPDATRILAIEAEVPEQKVTPEDLSKRTVIRSVSDGKFYRVRKTEQLVELNTGLAQAWDIDSAVLLIHKHPDGPKVKDDFVDEEETPGLK